MIKYKPTGNKKKPLENLRNQEDILSGNQDSIEEYDIKALGNTLFLYLQQLSDLSMEQSKQLIENGFREVPRLQSILPIGLGKFMARTYSCSACIWQVIAGTS